MGKPCFYFSRYPAATTVTASTTATGTAGDNILTAVEHTGHSFTAAYNGSYVIDVGSGNTLSADTVLILGENIGDVVVEVLASSDGVNYTTMHADLITNGGFTTDTDWTKGSGWTIHDGEAYCDGTVAGETALEQGSFTASKKYLSTKSITYVGGSAVAQVGGAASAGVPMTTDYTDLKDLHTADGSGTFKIVGDSNFEGQIDNVSLIELITAQTDSLLRGSFTSGEYRYWKVYLHVVSTSAVINHVCLCQAQDFPYLEDDCDPDNLDIDVEHLVSQSGYFCGASVQAAMRKLDINFGSVVASDYAPILILADEVIKTGAACFFAPDVDEDTTYFGWFDSKSFSAPLRNAMYEVKSLSFMTRA